MNIQPNAAPAAVSAPEVPPVPSAEDVPEVMGTSDARLAGSINDAYTLLDFSCRRGAAPSTPLSETVVGCYHKLEKNTPLSAAEEVAFWSAFAEITELVKPVTVESIVFTTPAPPLLGTAKKHGLFNRAVKPVGSAEKVLRHYLLMAISTLLLLLMLQVGWAIGTFIYNDAFKVHHYLVQGKSDLLEAQLNSANVKGTPAAQQADLKLQQAQNRALQDQSWNAVSNIRLRWWNSAAETFLPPFDLTSSKQPDVTALDVSGANLDADGKQRLAFTRTELTLQVISNYYLVVLFALLGALTQALRSLSRQIQNVSLTANDLYRMRTRVILGVIAGVCMAWLYIIATTPQGAPGDNRTPLDVINLLGAFTPWAIAFISGYSVEIFFALLERVISIATDKIQGLDAAKLSGANAPDVETTSKVPPAPAPTPTPAPKPTP